MNFEVGSNECPEENFVIVATIPMTRGWTPINHMLTLLSTYFKCRLLRLDDKKLGFNDKLSAYLKPRKRVSGKPNVLFVVQTPAQLGQIFTIDGWRSSFNFVAAWIIDSFYTEHIPRFSLSNVFDALLITSGSDQQEYIERSGVKTSILLWGSDVLDFGGVGNKREIDLLRVGRQPREWDDDEDNQRCLMSYGLNYCGRPPDFGADSMAQKRLMHDFMQKTKLALAFSNLVDGSHYTHPRKEYITARWLDAIACGCQVVGVSPCGDYAFDKLLWPEALIELGEPSRDSMLAKIQDAVKSWSPAIAEYNYQMALEKFDWRWRFLELSRIFNVSSSLLSRDIEKIKMRLSS